jgi:hypothetical protein
MLDIIGEFARQLLRFPEGENASKLVIVLAFGLTTVVGIVLRVLRDRAVRRMRAAAAAYAGREMARHRRLHEPGSVCLISQPDRTRCLVSFSSHEGQ